MLLGTDGGVYMSYDKSRTWRHIRALPVSQFYRVSTGLVHDVKGSGLGLSIVRHIVEAHKGRVTVESRPGEGSTSSCWRSRVPPVAGSRAACPRP